MPTNHTDELRLIFPTMEHKPAALAYGQEHVDAGEKHIHGSGGLIREKDYESWLTKITNALTAAQGDWVNCQTYFALVGDKIVGTIQIREELNDYLLKAGGHIGYGVAPSERRKGYATRMLALALTKCREIGLNRVLITCAKGNVASEKTILGAGGVLENEIFDETDGEIVQRYWITLE